MRNPLAVHKPWDKTTCIPQIHNLFLLLKLQPQIGQMKTHPCKRDDAMSAAKCRKLKIWHIIRLQTPALVDSSRQINSPANMRQRGMN